MNDRQSERFEPAWPTLAALGFFCLWILILALPMFRGDFVAAPYNDQYATGYAFREWAATQWKATGQFPLWNSEIYAGLPFVAGMHGDLFYPTAFLRLILPTHTAMNLGFVIHYVLAALFMYALLRAVRTSWTAAVVGGLTYQLSGVIGSYVSPGHDGKLFVTALLPLGFLGLVWCLRDSRMEGWAVFSLSVGLALLSPHPQMAQYYLLAAGIFALYLAVGGPNTDWRRASLQLGGGLVAVAVGVGIALIQYLPFLAYIPYSPRDLSGAADLAFSASYAIPWTHVPELFIPHFVGEAINGSYWGTNGTKLHSEYLGLAALVLAGYGALDPTRRRPAAWLGGMALLFLLIAMGTATPFFRIWWEIVPFVKSTRAPGMALFVVSAVVAILAAFGVHRLEGPDRNPPTTVWLVIGGVVATLGLFGAFGAIAETLAIPQFRPRAVAGAAMLRLGAFTAGAALIAIVGLVLIRARAKIPAAVLSVGVIAVIGTDLWLNARTFWRYSRVQDELFAPDTIKDYLRQVDRPFRVWSLNVPQLGSVYRGSALMADGIAQWYGHHGNELHSFDVVNGRQGMELFFQNEGHPRLMDLYAIRYLIAPAAALPDSVPGFRFVFQDVPSSSGVRASLLERETPIPYARVVPAAVAIPDDQMVPTLLDGRVPMDRVVLFSDRQDVRVDPLETLPPPSNIVAQFATWSPGHMRVELNAPLPGPGYLVVSENWYPDWVATVDGRAVESLRGNGSLIVVPLEAGSRSIELRFVSREYSSGKVLTFASLALVMVGLVVPPFRRRGQ